MAVKKESKVILRIANTDIEIGKTYELLHKFDGSAPDGMRGIKATKFPLMGIEEVRSVFFDESRNAFDTGFYLESASNRLFKTEDIKTYLPSYITQIKKPYEQRFNVDCSEVNTMFWDKYKTRVSVNKSFNTNDIKDLFDLFIVLKQGIACNEGELNQKLQKASFIIKDITEDKSKEDEILDNKYEAVSVFKELVKTDTEKLYTILEYLKATSVRNVDLKILQTTYIKNFENSKTGEDLVNKFLKAFDKYSTETGKEEMQYFAAIQKLFLKNKLVKKAGAFYGDGDFFLGNSLQDISTRVMSGANLEHKTVVDKMIDDYLSNE